MRCGLKISRSGCEGQIEREVARASKLRPHRPSFGSADKIISGICGALMRKRIVRRPTLKQLQDRKIPQMCAFCSGTGKDSGAPCPVCRGRGQVSFGMGQMCAYCSGTGRDGIQPCPICNGTGQLSLIGGQPLIDRRFIDPPPAQLMENLLPPAPPVQTQLIAPSRIEELRACAPTGLDFTKLIRLCEEANTNYQGKCYAAVAMLTRAILDHVPPVFGQRSFDQVVANYAGGRSFKDSMEHLNEASRKVADALLHTPIRSSEVLPTVQQVNCGQQLDELLGEIVRIMPKASATDP